MTSPSTPAPKPSTTQLVAHFMRSIQDVLQTMADISVSIGKPSLKQDPVASYDVSGIIAFSGAFTGSMVLSFPQPTASAIVSAFAKVHVEPDSPDFADAVGELANMVAGSAKTGFGKDTNISIPSIIMGRGHAIARLHDIPCITIPCQTAHGDFAVEVNLQAPTPHLPPKGCA